VEGEKWRQGGRNEREVMSPLIAFQSENESESEELISTMKLTFLFEAGRDINKKPHCISE
jgi:hypothetical protein